MPPESARAEDARAWLVKASLDLRAAELDLGADEPLAEDAEFHCQQAVEKAMKAFLSWHDTPFRKTHSIEEIGRQRAAIDPSLAELVDRVVPMTEYAWKFRYPGEAETPGSDEAAEAALAPAETAREVGGGGGP